MFNVDHHSVCCNGLFTMLCPRYRYFSCHNKHLLTTTEHFFSLLYKRRKRQDGGDSQGFPFEFTPPMAQHAAICRRCQQTSQPVGQCDEGGLTSKFKVYGVCYTTFLDCGSKKGDGVFSIQTFSCVCVHVLSPASVCSWSTNCSTFFFMSHFITLLFSLANTDVLRIFFF